MRVGLVCAVLLLAAPSPAPAYRPTLGVVDVASGHRTALAHQGKNSEGWSSVRWTPDGAAVVAVSGDPGSLTVRRYPVAGGHARTVRDLGDAFEATLSSDGTLVAALYDGGQGIPGGRGGVVVRELATGRALLRLPQHAEGDDLYENGLEVAWSRDSGRLAYIAQERRGRTLRIADVRSGRVLRRVDATRLYDLGLEPFSPSGDRLAYPSGDNGRLTLLGVAAGPVQRTGEAGVFAASWAPAGERLAISRDGRVAVSDEQRRFGVAQAVVGDAVDVIRWSPDGTMLALRAVKDLSDYRTALAVMPVVPSPAPPRFVIPYRYGGIGGFAWSPDGGRIAYAG